MRVLYKVVQGRRLYLKDVSEFACVWTRSIHLAKHFKPEHAEETRFFVKLHHGLWLRVAKVAILASQ